ncbi:MAG: ABC transporter permease subunit [Planctomycetia bacterium]|nr:ABC transporter permease subunit [Planctomycetia bacterium]
MAVAALGAPAQAQEVLRWGADKEGGAPYVFSPDDEPDRLIGFEIELADALAAKLNSRSEFVQGQWDQLLSVLRREDVDIVLNGYEYTPDRASQYLASYPYYVYELGLAVLRDDAETRSWDDLGQPYKDGRRKRIGVLTQSAADLYVTARYEASCEIFRFDGVTECLRGIETGQLDASVQDGPILAHYVFQAAKFPSLAVVDKPVAPGYYVVYVRPEDKARVEAVNRAIRELYDEGKLRQIYDRYGLWNAAQNSLPEVWKTWDSSLHERRTTAWRSLVAYFPKFAIAASVTVLLSIISMPLAILIGLLVSIVRMWSSPVLGGSGRTTWLGRLARAPFTIYVELVRGSPLAFQLFVVFFVLPEIGIRIPPFWSGVIALAINYSAYEAEIFRLGLQAIPKGQIEAALALGMPRMLAVRRIILPQAVRLVIPATANDFIALFKDTAVCSVIAVEELSKQYSMAAKSTTLFLEMAVMASVLYLSMSYPLSLLATFLEKKLKREQNA